MDVHKHQCPYSHDQPALLGFSPVGLFIPALLTSLLVFLRPLGRFGSNEEDPVGPADAFPSLVLDLITRALQTGWSQWGSQCFYNVRAEEEKNMASYYIWKERDRETEREATMKET